MTRRALITQEEMVRAMRAAKKMGWKVARVEATAGGGMARPVSRRESSLRVPSRRNRRTRPA